MIKFMPVGWDVERRMGIKFSRISSSYFVWNVVLTATPTGRPLSTCGVFEERCILPGKW